jgi:hypothetical protein
MTMILDPDHVRDGSEGAAILWLRIREIELAMGQRSIAAEARRDAALLISKLRRQALNQPHGTTMDLAAKLRLITTCDSEGPRAIIDNGRRPEGDLRPHQ